MAEYTPKQLLAKSKLAQAQNLPSGQPMVASDTATGQVGTKAGAQIAKEGAKQSMAKAFASRLLPAATGALTVATVGEEVARAADDTWIGRSAHQRESAGDAPVIGAWDEDRTISKLFGARSAQAAQTPSVQTTAPVTAPAVTGTAPTNQLRTMAMADDARLNTAPAVTGTAVTPFFTDRADLAAQRGLQEVTGVVGGRKVFGNRQLGTPGESGQVGGFVQANMATPEDDGLGDSKLAGLVRSIRGRQDSIRKEKAAAVLAEKQVALDREDTLQAALNRRADDRLAFDKEKEFSSEIEKRFTTLDPDSGKPTTDYTAAVELKDYIGRTGEKDVTKAVAGLQKEKALAVAKQYGDANALAQAVAKETDPAKKTRLQQLYQTAYGA